LMTDKHAGENRRADRHFKEPFLHKYVWIHIRTLWNDILLPCIRGLEIPGHGAAAHMSLHLTDNEKEPMPYRPDFYIEVIVLPISRDAEAFQKVWLVAAGDVASMEVGPSRQQPFCKIVSRARKARKMAGLRLVHPHALSP
jgi:hypothetical protein